MVEISTINLVYLISFLDLFAVGLTFPLFGNYLRELGASHTLVGLFSSVYSGLQLFSGPLIGGWSDVRDRKSVLQVTLVLCSISYGLLGITNSLFFILILRIVVGIAKHTQSICKAVISDLVPVAEQTGAYGKSAALGSLGFIVGPFIGGHLSEIKHGFTYVSGLTAILFLINLGIARLLPENSFGKVTDHDNNISLMSGVKQEFKKTFKELKDIDWKVHWDSFLLRFLFCLSITCYFSNQTLYLKEKYELSQKYIGYIISFFSTIGMFSAFFLDYINGFYKNDDTCLTRLFHFSFLLTVCFISIAISPNLVVLLVLMVPFSIASTSLRVVSMEFMLKKSDDWHRGSLSGASNSVMSLARFLAPFLTGVISDIFTENSVMFVGAAMMLPENSFGKVKNHNNNISLMSGVKQEFQKTFKELKDIDWKVHWDSFLLRFLFCLSITCYFSNQTLYLKEKYELSQKHIGYIISFFSTVGMFSAFFLDYINRFYKNDDTCLTRLFHFSFLLTACFISIAVSPSLVVLLVLMVPFSIASTSIRVVSMEYMLKKSDDLHRGSLSGASNSVMSLARFLAPFLTGVISDIFTENSVMFVGVLPSSLCVILILYIRKYVQTRKIKNN